MMRLPRLHRQLPALVIACALALSCLLLLTAQCLAQEAPAAPAATAPAAAPATAPAPAPAPAPGTESGAPTPLPLDNAMDPAAAALYASVEDFWHYGKVARYDLATAEGNKLLGLGASPVDMLKTFEKVTKAGGREDEMYRWLLRWQEIEAMKDISTKMLDVLRKGNLDLHSDPTWIKAQIDRLINNELGFTNGVNGLRQSGEVAVPYMLDYLRDPAKRKYHAAIRAALAQLGRVVLNPLVAATESKDNSLLIPVVTALGEIGYTDAAPYISRLAKGKDTATAVKEVATQTLVRMGFADPKKLNSALMFYDLAERMYYGNSSITADNRYPMAYVWFWEEGKGLYKRDVPPAIFNDVMSMRASEYSLKLSEGMGDALSLWLAANFKREVDLGVGHEKDDPTRGEKQPNAEYYGTEAGTSYLNAALERALRDRNAAVALRATKALALISGQANLFGTEHQPIIDALNYPDRLVRYEAALAIANALPQKNFDGQEQVVPILADALAQTGKPNALVYADSQEQYNVVAEQLKAAGYGTAGGITPDTAVAAAAQLPAVDVILISEAVKPVDIDKVFVLIAQTPRLERVARVIITASKASPWAVQSIGNPLLNTTTVIDAPHLGPVLATARQRSGALPMDEKTAADYAMRAAALLQKLAISRGQVLDLNLAQVTLIGTLEDSRLDLAKAAGSVLALLNTKAAQLALANKATDDKAADDLKVSLFKSLAVSARFFGNQLEPANLEAVQKSAENAPNLDVRGAAAESCGSLNLPADKAKALVIGQSKT